jgi:uncharacterized protein YdbL (DUF1318 family)
MKYVFIISLFIFIGCQSDEVSELEKLVENNNSNETQTNKTLIENLRISYNETIEPENSNVAVIPIILEEKYREKGISNYNYSNILFHNANTGENNFLFQDSIDFISTIRYFTPPSKDKNEEEVYESDIHHYGTFGNQAYGHLFYIIKPWKTKKELKEINGDKDFSYRKLKSGWTETGPSTLYMSDFDGKNLVALSPSNGRVIDWIILRKTNFILAKVLMDSNNDQKFNKKDDIKLIRIDLTKPSIGQPILSLEEENAIKKNLLKGKTGI